MKLKPGTLANRPVLTAILVGLAGFALMQEASAEIEWSESEAAILRSQWIGSLPALSPDPTNKYADNQEAAALGHRIFFDTRFSLNGKVSCATCHQPEKGFTDGLALSKGVLESARSSPTLVGISYSPWFFWDGSSDSQWSQALGPLESGREHGGNRTQYARILYEDPDYKKAYEKIFGSMPDLSDHARFPEEKKKGYVNALLLETAKPVATISAEDKKSITRVFVNMGKAIAAYERLIMPGVTRFDHYVEALLKNDKASMDKSLSSNEVAGLKLFIGKAMCVTCHQGPLFTHNGFHNIGMPSLKKTGKVHTLQSLRKTVAPADQGRYRGVQKATKSEFNCLSKYSDAKEEDCAELRFARTTREETLGAFKVPTLRNIANTAPYMHAGQLASLKEVLEHYSSKPRARLGHSDLLPVSLSDRERSQIETFLHSLSGLPAIDPKLMKAP